MDAEYTVPKSGKHLVIENIRQFNRRPDIVKDSAVLWHGERGKLKVS